MQSLWFVWRMKYLIGELAELHYTKHHQLHRGAILHRVGPDSRMLLSIWLWAPCWLGLRYVTSRVMCSVFAPKLWLEQNLMPINQTEQRATNTKWCLHHSQSKELKHGLVLSTAEFKACEEIRVLLNFNYTDIPILNETPKCCNTSLSHWKYLNKSDVSCLMTSKGRHQLH